MMVRNVSGSYTKNEGLMLPGYAKKTQLVGMDPQFNAPGLPFILGQQNTDVFGNEVYNFAIMASQKGWLIQSPYLNNPYSETFSETWNLRANLEPIKYLKIELTATRKESRNLQSFFRFNDDPLVNDYELQ